MSGSIYDQLIAEQQGAAPGAPTPSENTVYDDILRESREGARVRAALTATEGVKPERVVELKELSRITGLPRMALEQDDTRAKAQAQYEEIVRQSATSPALRRRLADTSFTELAKDDVGVLAQIEQGIGNTVGYLMGATDKGGVFGDLQSGIHLSSKGGAGMAEAVVGTIGTVVESIVPLESRLAGGNPLLRLAERYANIGKEQEQASKDVGSGIFGVSSGVASLAQNAKYMPLLALGPVGAVGMLAGMTAEAFGGSYRDAREAGLTQAGALVFGASQAAIEFWTERIPMGALMDSLAKGTGLMPMLTRVLGQELKGEQIATVLQDLNQWSAIDVNQGKTFRDYLNERPSAALETAIATVIGTGGQVTLIKAADKILDGYVQAAYADQVGTKQYESIQQLMGMAMQSKLRERDPQLFRETLQEMLDQQGPDNSKVYVDGEILQQLSADGLASFGDLSAQIEESLATGVAVELPLAQVLAVTAGTPDGDLLMQYMRGAPGQMSAKELTDVGGQANAWLAAASERYIEEAPDAIAALQEYNGIKADIEAQLNTAARTPKGANAYLAEITAMGMAAMASRLGRTATEVYNENKLSVTGNSSGNGGTTLQQELPPGVEIREAADGYGFEAFKDGVKVGYLKDNLLSGQAQQIDENANIDIVTVDKPARGTGVGAALYAAFTAKHGGRVAPSGKTTKDAWKVWKRDYPAKVREFAEQEAARIIGGADPRMVIGNITDPEVAELVSTAVANGGRVSARVEGDTLKQEATEVALPKKAKTDTAITLRNGPRVEGKQAMSVHGVGAFFDKITGKRDINDPKEQKRAVKQIVAELKYQMEQEKSGLDWYEEDVKLSFTITQQIIPELANEQTRQLFSVLAGLQSPGTNARDNWVIAAEALQHYLKTGTIPGRNPKNGNLWMGGPVSANKEKSLNFLNAMVQDIGETATVEWLMSSHSVRELNEARGKWGGMGPGVSGKATDELMGLFAFGPKVGPFVMNINGIHELTIDVWATRTLNRLFGQMTGPDGKIVDAPTEPQRRIAKELFNEAAKQVGIKPYQVQSVLWFFEQQLFNHLGAGSASYGFSDGARKFADGVRDAGSDGKLAQTVGDAGTPEGLTYVDPEGTATDTPAGDGTGGYAAGGLAPLPGAPAVEGASGPDSRLVAVAEQYAAAVGIDLRRQSEYVAVDPALATRIAAAYEAMEHNPADPAVAEAYANLIAQTRAQYDALTAAGYRFTFFDSNSDPYGGNPWNAMRDLRANQTMAVYGTYDGFGVGSELNVGLADPQGGPPLDPAAVIAAVQAAGGEVEASSVHTSDTEPTLVIKLKTRIEDTAAEQLSATLGQEAIAQRFGDGTGRLHGPQAANWGDYNPEFFLTLDGRRASDGVNPLLADTGLQWPDQAGVLRPVTANDLFRAVHDAFGHGLEGAGFRAQGEENAWQAHSRLFTGSAVGAITSETRGQNSWLNYGPYGEQNRNAKVEDTVFADQKTGLMPEWTWTEGRSEDRDDGTQLEQRRMRQAVDMVVLQRTGEVEEATPVEQTDTPMFKAWFDGSTVLDNEGKPLVLYHATTGDFAEFMVGGPNPSVSGPAVWLTSSKERQPAAHNTGARGGGFRDGTNVMPLYARIKRPLLIDDKAMLDWARETFAGGSKEFPQIMLPEWVAEVTRDGEYDGIFFDGPALGWKDATTEYIVFAPTQLKSAISNNGTFDPADPSILKQEAKPGEVAITGTHFSKKVLTSVDGRFYGTGLRGLESQRLNGTTDQRLKARTYFYVDEGKGVRPEAGVGGYAHTAELPNMYDINKDPLKLIVGGNINQTESNILDAGFDGYYVSNAFNQQGAAVVIGDASRGLGVTPIPNPTTKAPPIEVAPSAYTYGLLSREAAALDITTIQAVAPSARLQGGNFRVDPAEFDAAAQAAAAQGVNLPAPRVQQGNQNLERGTFNVKTLEVVLTENADLSTFIHENGHFFLEMLMKYGGDANSPADVQQDAQKVLAWFGVKDVDTWMGMTLEQKRPYHERFAESYEQYLFEGKAPTKDLQPVYRRFSAFLKQVYGSVQNMLKTAAARGSDMTLEINDDIRGVMDRLMSADAIVKEAEERLGGEVSEAATGEALEAMQARSLRNMKWLANARSRYVKELQAKAKEIRKAVQEEVAAEVRLLPVVMARRALDALKIVPEHKVLLDQHKADRAAAEEAAAAESREAALAIEEAQSGARPAGLKLGQWLAKNKREIANATERRMIAWDRDHPRPLRPVNATDQDMATIADSFGYPGVEEMVQAINDFGREADVVGAMTDQRMLEEYGDLVDQRAIEEAANEAVHNDARVRAVATEIAAEQAAMNPRRDTGTTNAAGSKVTVNVLLESVRKFAEQTVFKTLVRDLRGRRAAYNAAEKKAGTQYTEAKRKGKNAEAIAARQRQLLNTTTAKRMDEAVREAQKMVEFLRKVLADSNEELVKKGRDADVVNAMRAVLFEFGIGTKTAKSADGYLKALANNDPETAATLQDMVAPMLDFAQPIDALAFGELKELHDSMQAMWFLSKQMRQMEVGGDKIDIQDAADELSTRLAAVGVPLIGPGDLGTMTDAEKRVSGLRFMRAALTRAEQWAQSYGPEFTKYLFRPIKEAADRYRSDRVKYRKAYIALLEAISPSLKDGNIVAPELGNYIFGRGKVRGHAELLHAVLHTGNDSNKRKLLLGRGWATENADGTLDTTKWDAFILRMQDQGYLGKAHYDFAQKVWDLLEQIKPLAQRAHREVYGRYFDEVTATPFDTPFGSYRGGYVPAQASMENAADADRAQMNEQNEALINAFPSAPRGFTKSRVDYSTKLSLDLASLGTHIDQVLRFAHMQPAVRGVTRLLKNKSFSQPMSKVDNGAIGGLLLPFLQRASRQSSETPVYADGGAMRLVSLVRGRAGMALMMGNLLNAVQQLSGFVNAGARVRPALMLQAAAQFVSSPKRFNAAVASASPFMKDRMANEIAAINEAMEDVLLDPTLLNKAQAWTNRHAYFLQAVMDNTMSPIVWTAAYNQSIAEGKGHTDAAFEADAVVRTTQTTTLPEDISRAESGNPLIRLFTQFANYFNMLANTYVADMQKLARDGGLANNKARALYVTFVGLLLPIWVAEGIALAFRGGPADEDEDGYYWDDWIANVMGMGTARSLLAAVPGIGQLGIAAINRFNDNPMDDRASLSPVVSLLETAGGIPYKLWRLADGEDVKARTLVNDSATAISVGLGLPARAIARPAGYLAGVAQGEIAPTSPSDFVRGLLTGTPSEESKQ